MLVFGCPVGGVLAGYFGRRPVLMYACVPAAASWLVLAAAPSFPVVLLARVLGATAPAAVISSIGVFISEIAHPRYRGSFAAMQSLSLSLGMLLSYLLFNFMGYRSVALAALALPVINFSLMYFLPETPYWLVENGRKEDAKWVEKNQMFSYAKFFLKKIESRFNISAGGTTTSRKS